MSEAQLQQTIGSSVEGDTLQKLEALKGGYDLDAMLAEKKAEDAGIQWPSTDELLLNEPGVAEALRAEKNEASFNFGALQEEPEPLLEAHNYDAVPGVTSLGEPANDHWFDDDEPTEEDEAIIDRAFAGVEAPHVADRAEPFHASGIHEEESDEPATLEPAIEKTRSEPLEPFHANSIHEEAPAEEVEAQPKSPEANEEVRENALSKLRGAARAMKSLSGYRDNFSEAENREYEEREADLVALFKECEAAGVGAELLEYVAKDIDESLASRETGRHTEGRQAPAKAPLPFDTIEDEGIDDAGVFEEAAPVSAAAVVEREQSEEVQESTLDRVKGWWSKNRESVKKPFGMKFWAERWDSMTDKYKDLSASTAAYFTDVVRDVAYKVNEIRFKEDQRLLETRNVEQLQKYKENRRKFVLLGVGGLAAVAFGAELTNVIHGVAGSGVGEAATNLHGSGAHDVLATASPSSSTHEALHAVNGVPVPKGVTIEQGPTTSHVIHEAAGSTNVGDGASTHEFMPSNATLGHGVEKSFPSGSFKITSGEGGIQLFDRLGLHASDWSGVKEDLLKRFPSEFYNAGGDIRINHTGELPKAVQQYITNRFKG